ncbi:MAG: SGNH/GDSL hydrolase family protein [Alphaproteobacteria bacterium]|nr:SGNH/GDSL hydrolase family protein [Alphaproteobacteria bacterium]
MMLKNIGIIGDSIAHGYYDEKDLGWFTRLGKIILENHPDTYLFNNMSQSGDNIADTTNRAIFEVLSRHFDLILVNTGINDLRRRKNSDLQLDFSEGAQIMYWNKLFDILALTKAKIVVLDLTPVIENRYTEQASLIRYNSDIERYNQIIKEICNQKNINFFARYDKWKNRNLDILYKDATHPNSEGHQIMAEEVYDYLEQNKVL